MPKIWHQNFLALRIGNYLSDVKFTIWFGVTHQTGVHFFFCFQITIDIAYFLNILVIKMLIYYNCEKRTRYVQIFLINLPHIGV